jgi:hypothetical protein
LCGILLFRYQSFNIRHKAQVEDSEEKSASKRELAILQRRFDKYQMRLKQIEKLCEEPEAVRSGKDHFVTVYVRMFIAYSCSFVLRQLFLRSTHITHLTRRRLERQAARGAASGWQWEIQGCCAEHSLLQEVRRGRCGWSQGGGVTSMRAAVSSKTMLAAKW